KDTFSFSFRLPMVETEDDMDVSCTIKIEDNEIKTGRVIDLVAHSHKSGEVIFHIYSTRQKRKMEEATKELPGSLFKNQPRPKINNLFTIIKANIQYFTHSVKKLNEFLINNGIYNFHEFFEENTEVPNAYKKYFSFYSDVSGFFGKVDSIEDRFKSVLYSFYGIS